MKFFLTSLTGHLQERLTSWRTWTLLILFPLAMFAAARLLPAQEVSAPVQVGVVLPEEGGEDFWRRLEKRSGLVVSFQLASYDTAERQVAAGLWDCALLLPEDFEARLKRQELEGLFTLLIGPGSTVYPIVRETAAACAAECVSPQMAEQYLLNSGILEAEELNTVRPRLEQALPEGERVLVSLETVDGTPLDPLVLADSGVSNLLAGLTAIVLLIWVLFAAMDLGRWLDAPFARRLTPLRGGLALLLPRLAGELCPALCAGMLALLAAGGTPACLMVLIPYLMFWGAAALAAAQCRPLWSALPALMPFVPALCLLLSPVLLDLSLLFPTLAPVIRWMPVTLYLRACGGAWQDGLVLAFGGGGLLLLSLIMGQKTNREPS